MADSASLWARRVTFVDSAETAGVVFGGLDGCFRFRNVVIFVACGASGGFRGSGSCLAGGVDGLSSSRISSSSSGPLRKSSSPP